MKSANRRGNRSFRPRVQNLENRRLLATVGVVSLGQDGVDLTGPSMSIGPDGLQDIHLQLTNLQLAEVSQIQIVGPASSNSWAFGKNKAGAANAVFFQAGSYNPGVNPTHISQYTSSGDLYLNPTTLPSGGGGGATTTLHTGDQLSISITYGFASTPQDTGSVTLVSIANPPLAMPSVAIPANVNNSSTISITVDGQDNNNLARRAGFVHLVVNNLPGAISTAEVSDQAGEYGLGIWQYPYTGSSGAWAIQVIQFPNSSTADIFFPPTRDETQSILGVSSASDMTLRLTFNGDTSQYVKQFAGGAWNPGLMATQPLNRDKPMLMTPTNGPELAYDVDQINKGTSGTANGVISLQAITYILTDPLKITQPIKIIGNGAILDFQPNGWSTGGPNASSPLVQGAIYTAGKYYSDLVVDIENLTINFAGATMNAWFDPANDHGTTAVINLSNDDQTRQYLTLSGVTILGPPAYIPGTWPSSPNPSTDNNQLEVAMDLVLSGNYDSGSITSSKFQGGPVHLQDGPWIVGGTTASAGNIHYGAMTKTGSNAAFSFQTPHDVLFESNVATQNDTSSNDPNSSIHSAPEGHLFRLVNLQGGGFNDKVENNSFSGGWLGSESFYFSASGITSGPNAPESVLAESGYQVFYEGQLGSVSADGRLLVLPPQSSNAASSWSGNTTQAGPGLVVSIINTQNADGSANPLAGNFYLVGQQISTSPPTFLMQSAFPQVTSASGKYVISISDGFVGDNYLNNTIDDGHSLSQLFVTDGRIASTAFVLDSQFGTNVKSNTITGGTTLTANWTGGSISIGAAGSSTTLNAAQQFTQGSGPNQFPMRYHQTDGPSLGVTISGNIIKNSVAGINLGLSTPLDAVPVSNHQGRLYLMANILSNSFYYDQSFLNQWNTKFLNYTSDNTTTVDHRKNSPNDISTPPTISVGIGVSGKGNDREASTLMTNGVFEDPNQLSVTIYGNSAYILNGSSTTPRTDPSGQVSAAVINGLKIVAPLSQYTSPSTAT